MEALSYENDIILLKIKRLIDAALYSLLPVTLLFVIFSLLSGSLTILNLAVGCGLGVIVRVFAFIAIRAILKSNIIRFPYGTGKLENFSGFLYGVLVVPTGLYLIYLSVRGLILPGQPMMFTITQIPLLVSLARNFWLYLLARKIRKEIDSPMVESYFINFKVASLFDAGVIVAVLLSMVMVETGFHVAGPFIDPLISLILAVYSTWLGVRLTIENFKVMMDLPLPEREQILIMNALAKEFEHYKGVGNILTRRSGRERFLDIELFLDADTSLADISLLQSRMQKHLDEHFPGIKFNLIPKISQQFVARDNDQP